MVFFNYATMQMAAKIVYYGPGLCGKTTNLHVIYSRTAPTARGEMVSLETETDRTLFFDLLPIDVGVIGGFKTRLQLYTVPGQVFYNTTRKLVLKGVDGVVFVADSQRPMLEPNRESFRNLKENLSEIGLTVDDLPLVLQFNKRDLSNILAVDELNAALNPGGKFEWYEASAFNGTGVFETLKGISKLTLRALRSRMSTDVKRPAVFPVQTPPIGAAAPAPPARPPMQPFPSDVFPQATTPPPPAQPIQAAPVPAPPRPAAHPPGAAAVEPTPVRPPAAAAARPPSSVFGRPTGEPRRPDDTGDIHFGEGTAPQARPPESVEQTMKHVKVRSNVDILSELEKLRKVSTQKPASAPSSGAFPLPPGAARPEGTRAKASGPMSIDDLLTSGLNHKKDVSRSFDVAVPREVLGKSRHVTIGLRFTDDGGNSLSDDRSFSIDLSGSRELQKLLLSLKINVQGE